MSCGQNTYAAVDQVNLFLEQPDIRDYTLMLDSAFGATISRIAIKSGMGEGVVSVLINGVAIQGMDQIDVSTTLQEIQAIGDNIIEPGDDLVFEILEGDDSLINLAANITLVR